MKHDHEPLQCDVYRRELLVLFASAIVAGPAHAQASSSSAPACTLTPSQTEGPFFVDQRMHRSDLRALTDGSRIAGMPLALALRVQSVAGGSCKPLPDAIVDIWHCDATGRYSEVEDDGSAAGAGFLRGYQRTDANGKVRFMTIYPGAYPGRAVHIHFKVRVPDAKGNGHELTSQLYFDDALTDRIHAAAPYSGRRGRRVLNENDGLFRHGGRQLMLTTEPAIQGYAAAFDVGLRLA